MVARRHWRLGIFKKVFYGVQMIHSLMVNAV